jgi:hypothetical protein
MVFVANNDTRELLHAVSEDGLNWSRLNNVGQATNRDGDEQTEEPGAKRHFPTRSLRYFLEFQARANRTARSAAAPRTR